MNKPGDPTRTETVSGSQDDKAPTIAVFGGCTVPQSGALYKTALELGARLARAGFCVLSGGYGGAMEAVSRGGRQSGGRTIGVTCPGAMPGSKGRQAPNSFLDEVIAAQTVSNRIEMMLNLADGVCVLGGGTGTLLEFATAWDCVEKGFLKALPIVLVGETFRATVESVRGYRPASASLVFLADDVASAVEHLHQRVQAGVRGERPARLNGPMSDATATVEQLKAIMRRFVKQREWQPFHDPKNLSASIAIEAAELMEHFQWLRSDELLDVKNQSDKMTDIKEEIADVLAYVLSFAESLDIDLAAAFSEKMVKNATKYPASQFKGRYE